MNKPMIITIMPCYNGKAHLEKSLAAFVEQDYNNKKLIIVDGKSTDGSHEIISKYIDKGYPIVWDKTIDQGISDAINIGLKHMNENDIFAYLGSDDVILPGVLAEVGNFFSLAKDLDAIYFDSYSYFGDTKNLVYRKCPTSVFSLSNLLKFGTIVGLQNIYIKGAHVVDGGFIKENKYSMDYELYVRLFSKRELNFTYIPKPSTFNYMFGNFSTQFSYLGRIEAFRAAVSHVGYKPRLILKGMGLILSRVKAFIK